MNSLIKMLWTDMKFCPFPFVVILLFTVSCCEAKSMQVEWKDPLNYSNDSLQIDLSRFRENGIFVITDTIDLKAKTLYLPQDICLKMRDGIFVNGIIVGNNTIIEGDGAFFDKVHIKGKWNVPHISTVMFRDLSYDNALKDVFALSSPNVKNTIEIGKGIYQVTAITANVPCLQVNSNTDVRLKGRIIMTPNGFTHYNIIRTIGSNISISGGGSIIGDKHSHLGNKGEWGMGINISGGDNVKLKDITIKDCWGDCIYIANRATNVMIDNCMLDHGRRQGISITSASNVTIKNCLITNVGGTNPQYAIDVEPNARDTVNNVKIINVQAVNCHGGFECYGWAEQTLVDNILIKNCVVDNSTITPLAFRQCGSVIIDNNRIRNCRGDESVLCVLVNAVQIKKTRITKKGIKAKSLKSLDEEIKIVKSKEQRVRNNVIIQH